MDKGERHETDTSLLAAGSWLAAMGCSKLLSTRQSIHPLTGCHPI